jgi:ribose 1,5-bisphosphokinase PhnN
LAENCQQNETVLLNAAEAAPPFHALRIYTELNCVNLSVSTTFLENKLEKFVESRQPKA